MFGNKTSQAEGKNLGSSYNSILAGTEVQGKLQSVSDLRIDGKVEGDVSCQARLVVGGTGQIKGDLTCKQARLEGQIKGNVLVEDSLEIKQTAKVEGDIQARKLIIEEGAVFNGRCTMLS